jgi:hypothetical protein
MLSGGRLGDGYMSYKLICVAPPLANAQVCSADLAVAPDGGADEELREQEHISAASLPNGQAADDHS